MIEAALRQVAKGWMGGESLSGLLVGGIGQRRCKLSQCNNLMPRGVTGNTSDSGSEDSWFDSRRGNLPN